MVGPWIFYQEEPVSVVVGDGLADNYLEFSRFRENILASPVSIDNIGYNNGDKIIILQHPTSIAQNGIQSIHLDDNSTAYQNTTGDVVHAIISPEVESGVSFSSYKLYSAPTTDSVASATEVFDSTDIISNWDLINTFLTSVLVPIQNNHFIVIENTSSSAVNIRIRSSVDQVIFALVKEPAS